MASKNYSTTRRFESAEIPGVVVILKKMTEGRRLELRKLIGEPNKMIREILREQAAIEKMPEESRDMARWLELQDSFDQQMLENLNPAWIRWGVKQVEGLQLEGKVLGVEELYDWPSMFFDEVLTAVKEEAELNGGERKNSESCTTSGEVVPIDQKPSTATSASDTAGGGLKTVDSTSRSELN